MKKRCIILLAIMILLSAAAYADCQNPMNSKTYTTDRRFCSDTFSLQDGIIIDKDNVVIDCNHAVIKGTGFEKTGITIRDRNNIIIKNCKIANYETGVYIQNSTNIIFYGNTLMRNKVGVRLSYVTGSNFDENFDISLERPVKMTSSSGNTVRFVNKQIEDDFCRNNRCNIKGNFTLQENEIEKKSTLFNALKSSIQEWIFH